MNRAHATALSGIAGVHHVVSELSRRGLIALPTVRNLAAYDILVSTVDGSRHANVQVKASNKPVGFFPMPSPDRIATGKHDWYVLLRWLPTEQRYEGFMLTGREARREVLRVEQDQRQRIRNGRRHKLFPALVVGAKAGRRPVRWQQRWRTWRLDR